MTSPCRSRTVEVTKLTEPVDSTIEGKIVEAFEDIRKAVAKMVGVDEDQVVMLMCPDDLKSRLERIEDDPETEL